MIVTNRDKKVLEFLKKFKVATTDTIKELFYPSLRITQKRLKLLYDDKIIKRQRDTITQQYIYYINKPKQIKHDLLLTDFYREMNKISQIKLFDKEFKIEHVRADGFMAYEHKAKKYIAFIEVQIANTPLNIKKYETLYKYKTYKQYFPVFPLIFAITNKTIPKTTLKIIKIKEDMSDIELRR